MYDLWAFIIQKIKNHPFRFIILVDLNMYDLWGYHTENKKPSI